MDFSLTTVFVKPAQGALATTGGTGDLAPGQIGIFKKSLAAVAVGGDTQFVVAQGRNAGETLSTSKKSDLIDRTKIIQYRKVSAVSTQVQKAYSISSFAIRCGEEFNLSLKIFENYLDASFAGGMDRTFTIPSAPCCPCDGAGDPCDVLDPEALVTALVAKINADKIVGKLVIAAKVGTGLSTSMTITGLPTQDEVMTANVLNNPYTEPNVVDFYVYATKSLPTSFDEDVYDTCGIGATVTKTADYTYKRGSGHEVKTIEAQHYSYQTDRFKHMYADNDLNVGYSSNVVLGSYYDEFLIKMRTVGGNKTWNTAQEQDNTVRIFALVGADSTAMTTALNTAVGATEINTEY